MKPKLIDIIRAGNTLGEGVQWDDVTETLWWTDIQDRFIYNYHPNSGRLKKYSTPERLCSFGFVEKKPEFVVAFDRGFALYNPVSKNIHWLKCPEGLGAGIRFNDGKVDRQGRFWAGTMVEGRDPTMYPEGNLYCLDAVYRLTVHESGIGISNGLCWSPESDRMYFADSCRKIIYSYDFESDSGTMENRNIFVLTGNDAYPDGADIDCEGCLWSAHWGGGQVVRYTPAGQKDIVLDLPVSQPTCVAFGGPGMDLLFVTSAKEGLDKARLFREPDAGNVFVYQVGISGLPASRFIKSED